MRPPEIRFEEAKRQTSNRRRNLLLGNGFSIGVHRAFGYPSLFKAAVKRDPSLSASFRDHNNPNFEDALKNALDVTERDRIRSGLIKAVAAVHPYYSLSLNDEQHRSCSLFLKDFVGRERTPRGLVFTTNYDLLLHWAVSRQPRNSETKWKKPLVMHDGFDNAGIWHSGVETQVFYLHGAVHINQHPYNSLQRAFFTQMLRYEMRRPIITQVEAHLNSGRLPVFVAEGTANEKIASQQKWEYLKKARKTFETLCQKEDDALFTFGHSLGSSDDHIIDWIGKGRIGTIYLGVFTEKDRDRAGELQDIWQTVRANAGLPRPTVCMFDASACQVWGKTLPEI